MKKSLIVLMVVLGLVISPLSGMAQMTAMTDAEMDAIEAQGLFGDFLGSVLNAFDPVIVAIYPCIEPVVIAVLPIVQKSSLLTWILNNM